MNRRRARDGAVALVIGFSATVAAFAAGELRSTGNEELGELDVFGYCEARHGERSIAALLAWNAYGWQCTVGDRITMFERPDFDEACRMQYGVDDAEARTADESWPFGWRCFAT